jgi:hypothetical protein
VPRSPLPALPDGLPTPRYMLAADCADLSLFCHACLHRRIADLEELVCLGHGDTPLIRLRWKCGRRGSTRHVSAVVTGRHCP